VMQMLSVGRDGSIHPRLVVRSFRPTALAVLRSTTRSVRRMLKMIVDS